MNARDNGSESFCPLGWNLLRFSFHLMTRDSKAPVHLLAGQQMLLFQTDAYNRTPIQPTTDKELLQITEPVHQTLQQALRVMGRLDLTSTFRQHFNIKSQLGNCRWLNETSSYSPVLQWARRSMSELKCSNVFLFQCDVAPLVYLWVTDKTSVNQRSQSWHATAECVDILFRKSGRKTSDKIHDSLNIGFF